MIKADNEKLKEISSDITFISRKLKGNLNYFILKKGIKKLGKIKFIIANVVNDWEKYGVHMLDIIDEIGFLDVKKTEQAQFFLSRTVGVKSEITFCILE